MKILNVLKKDTIELLLICLLTFTITTILLWVGTCNATDSAKGDGLVKYEWSLSNSQLLTLLKNEGLTPCKI
jgi:hypothetical protein